MFPALIAETCVAQRERCRDDRDTDAVASKNNKPEPTAEQQAAEELVRRAREQGLSLTGLDGLLKQLPRWSWRRPWTRR